MNLGSGEWVTPAIQLLKQVDGGAMGSVWLADHTGLQTSVAVKFVAERFTQNPAALRRLESEARAAAQLKSPHVVKIFDYGVYEGRPYFVMEFLEGESLRERLDRQGKLSPRDVGRVVTHVARGLVGAHRLRIIHRDIKPENLFLLDEVDGFFVKILDFGVAKGQTKGLTEPGLLVGTPVYMSREAVVDQVVEHHADLWALAVVAYEALTGELPFDGETIEEVCTSIWRGTFKAPSMINFDLTPAIDEWFVRAFHRERQERFADAKQLAASFVRAIASMPDTLHLDALGDDEWRVSSQVDLSAYAPSSNPSSSGPPISDPPSSDPPSSIPPTSGPLSGRSSVGALVVSPALTRHRALAPRRELAPTAPPSSVSATDIPGLRPSRRRYAVLGIAALGIGAIALATSMSRAPAPSAGSGHDRDAVSAPEEPAPTTLPTEPRGEALPAAAPATRPSASSAPSSPQLAPSPIRPGGAFPLPRPLPSARPKKDLGF